MYAGRGLVYRDSGDIPYHTRCRKLDTSTGCVCLQGYEGEGTRDVGGGNRETEKIHGDAQDTSDIFANVDEGAE